MIAFSSNPLYIVERARCKWTGRRTAAVNMDNERLTVFGVYVVAKTVNLEIARCHSAD